MWGDPGPRASAYGATLRVAGGGSQPAGANDAPSGRGERERGANEGVGCENPSNRSRLVPSADIEAAEREKQSSEQRCRQRPQSLPRCGATGAETLA